MVSEKMQTHLQKVDAEGKFKDVKEIKEQETWTDSKLWQLALEIDVTATKEKTESKTDSFVKIDQLFSTLENTVEDKKQLALQYALNVIWLEIGEWEQSKIIWLKDIIVFFNKAVTQKEDGSWKLAMDLGKNGLTDDEKLIWAKFKDIIDNPTKHSALAYLIQRSAKEIINLEAAKWYWEESKRNEIAKVNADMYLWNQTRQALSALEAWIDSDLSENSENADYLKDLTVGKIKKRGFIDASLKAKLEAEEENGIPAEVKTFWKENIWEWKEYTRRYPHSTNFAIMKADWTVDEDDLQNPDGAVDGNDPQNPDESEVPVDNQPEYSWEMSLDWSAPKIRDYINNNLKDDLFIDEDKKEKLKTCVDGVSWNWISLQLETWVSDCSVVGYSLNLKKCFNNDWYINGDYLKNTLLPIAKKRLVEQKKAVLAVKGGLLKGKEYTMDDLFWSDENLPDLLVTRIEKYFNIFADKKITFDLWSTADDTKYDENGNIKLTLDNSWSNKEYNKWKNNQEILIFPASEIVGNDYKLDEGKFKEKLKGIVKAIAEKENIA